jgi:O-antigen ligase/tetratricopeptide (TPR) repeat protein
MKMKKQLESKLLHSNKSIYTIIYFTIFSLVFVISPYYRGLFFTENYYWVSLFLHVLLLATTVLYFNQLKSWIIVNWKIFSLLLGIGLVYLLSYIGSYVPYLARNELLQWVSYIALFIFLSVWVQSNKRISEGLWLLCWLTMLWIVGFVFLVDLGRLEFQDGVLNSRFASVFQYPNTLASMVSAFIVAGLMGLTKRVQIHYQLIYGMFLIPFFICFLLAESRGGFVVFAIGLVIALIFLTWKEQILYIFYTGLAITLSFLGFTTYSNLVAENFYFKSALVVIGLSLVFTLIVFSIQFLVNRKFKLFIRSKLDYVIPLGILGTGISIILTVGVKLNLSFLSIFPEAIQSRIRSINLEQHSVQERFLFYKDSITVWQDHFWFGAGGGGWRALFESYKSLPYLSTQAHSFYIQTLVEVGLIGSIFVFGFFLYVLLKGVWSYFKFDGIRSNHDLLAPVLMVVIVLMLHNAIDFNMAFGTYNLFLFVLLAIIWSYVQKHKELDVPATASVISKLIKKSPRIPERQRDTLVNIAIIIIIGTSVFSTYKSYVYAHSETLYLQVQQGGDYHQSMERIDNAIALNSTEPKLRELRIQLLTFGHQEIGTNYYIEAIDAEYQILLKLAPTNFLHYITYSKYLWEHTRYDDALASIDHALVLAPWQLMVYEENLKYRIDYSLDRVQAKDLKELKNQIIEISGVLNKLEDKLEIQEQELPKGLWLINRIRLTSENQLTIGKAFYYIGNFQKSLEYLSAIDMENLEDSTKQNVLLIKLLNYQALNQQGNLIELLNSEVVKVLAVDQMYQQLKDNQRWLPLTKSSE